MGAAIPALVGAAASVGGGLLTSGANNAAIDAQNQARQEATQRQIQLQQQENQRQENFRQQQQTADDASLQTMTPQAVQQQLTDIQNKNAAPGNVLTDAMAKLSPSEVAPASRADETQQSADDLSKRLATGAANTRQYLNAKSNVGAYDQLFQNMGRADTNTSQYLTMINKQRQGSLDAAGVANNYLGQSFADAITPNVGESTMGNILTDTGKAAMRTYSGYGSGGGGYY
jgi:hypothetical protein